MPISDEHDGAPVLRHITWGNARDRRRIVAREMGRGRSLVRLAFVLNVCVSTIRRDCEKLNIRAFSTIDDDDLADAVNDIIARGHSDMGYTDVESALIERGYRVQERRIRACLVSFDPCPHETIEYMLLLIGLLLRFCSRVGHLRFDRTPEEPSRLTKGRTSIGPQIRTKS